ncbi:MAG: SpoIIIAC/SpoIIIAD family protein [Eubacterium sp.]
MLQIIGIALCTVLCIVLLKDKAQAFSVIVSVCGAIAVLLIVLNKLSGIISSINSISAQLDNMSGYIKLMIKVLGITVITQLVADICRDNGENAIATVTETAAKVTIIALILPLFEAVISIVNGLVK